MPEPATRGELRRALGPWSAASIVVGTIIGSGIFLVPKAMVARVGSVEMVFLVWIAGGLLSLFGALSYAELAAAMPEAGGEYVYLREAYGPLWGFLYGWTQTWVAKSGSIAAMATGFFYYLANFRPELDGVLFVIHFPIGPGGGPLEIRYGQLLAVAVILGLAFVNYLGVRFGGAVQVFVTATKVGMIVAIILIGLGSGQGTAANLHSSIPATGGLAGFFAALGAALWAYDGWNNLVDRHGADGHGRGGDDAPYSGEPRGRRRKRRRHGLNLRRVERLDPLRCARAVCHGAGWTFLRGSRPG